MNSETVHKVEAVEGQAVVAVALVVSVFAVAGGGVGGIEAESSLYKEKEEEERVNTCQRDHVHVKLTLGSITRLLMLKSGLLLKMS